MVHFKIGVANRVVEVETLHVRSRAMCRDYMAEGAPDFGIRVCQREIDEEKRRCAAQSGECALWDGSLETIVLHKKLSEALIDYGVFMMHGAAVACRSGAYVFAAPSGVGKTTHVLKWTQCLPDAFIINGDKPFIMTDPSPMVCGSPWAGKENLNRNAITPLRAVVFLERAQANRMEPISFPEAFPLLYPQVYRPEDRAKASMTLRLLKRLDESARFYRFKCNNFMDDCFDVAYSALVGDEI